MTTSTSRADLDFLRSAARDLGFDVCEMTPLPGDWPAAAGLKAFVAAGRHGTMEWMERTLDRRAHPSAMWPLAKSALVVGMNYGPDHDPMAALQQRSRAAISIYAQGRDYHGFIKGKLKHLASALKKRLGGETKVFVDTAPLMEKPLAALAGIGWQGKHTNLVSREFGSWLFLGVILSTLELKTGEPEQDACGSCRACLDVCPTNAFPAPYQLDASACLSYLTIEHAGPIPETYRAAMGNRIFGCDDCLAVCPWNKFARAGRETKLQARDELRAPALGDLAALDDAAFRARFSGSAVKRIGHRRFARNVLYAIGNSGDPALATAARERLNDDDETVREAARWALDRLSAPD
ncbi:MAG TPA: tRNA epoxyqueuosine(34) reductase QueG [Caulobacteraceae bacterium]|jgi:epoxyqueuosine reductase|nr:tRNA epoxyqueuosine(34) reductase QueG [Caulobacteraceae bacterium]